jgi:hypothetical protein
MTVTFCTDAQILAEWPDAASLNGGVATFDDLRVLVKADIVDSLYRRDPPIEEDDLEDSTELMKCEVYGVLARLFLRAESVEGDWYSGRFKYYREEYSEQLAMPVSVMGEVRRRTRSIRMVRC